MFHSWSFEDSKDDQVDWMNNLARNIGTHPTLTDFAEVADLIARCHDLKRLTLHFPPEPIRYGSRFVYTEPQALAEFFRGLSFLEVPLRLQRLLIVEGILVRAEDFVSQKRHFRFLEDLTIRLEHERPYNLEEIGRVFVTLRHEEVHLKHIALTNLHPPGIVEYISSYSGLAGLSIESHGDHRDDSSFLIHNLFISLKLHRSSLTSLSFLVGRISPYLEIPRSHLSENAESFSALKDLKIEVHTSDEDLRRKDANHLFAWLEIALRFPALRSLTIYPVHEEPYDQDKAKRIWRFRKHAAQDFRRRQEYTFDIYIYQDALL
ncbi:hypothetical protein NP233_g9468 [Leucocoprinus birnbaumii]|uniref:Uncharacterized protein n=1 Tax=Leucocoprinus birnbaumii TaxID=56174 RepID=A0AAD5YSU2_9AGAR|nr:hypothetical protein NP233_g9468 [Leucocoprinus birnbaumii]